MQALCQSELNCQSRSGTLFVFINRSRTMVRALVYDGTGFWLMTKRLSKGKFQGWPSNQLAVNSFNAKQLRGLLLGKTQSEHWQKMEAQLKLVVRDRKNAMFHKTLTGAAIGDVITSIIATANQVNINVFEYFNWLQRENENVVAGPEKYLPWNFQKNHIESFSWDNP